MDTKQILSVLTGAVIGVAGTVGTVELTKEPVLEGEQAIVEQVPAVQPVIYVDEKCGEDSLLLKVGTVEMCSSQEVYGEFKTAIVDDLKTEKVGYYNANKEVCEKDTEGCIATPYMLELENRDLFFGIVAKEMMKDGTIKSFSENSDEAKAEVLELLDAKEDLKVIEPVEETIK